MFKLLFTFFLLTCAPGIRLINFAVILISFCAKLKLTEYGKTNFEI